MAVKPVPLARIAEHAGFGMADVAFLAGLEESTVGRLWDTPDWLDRIKGRSLQAIIQVLPGAGEYVLKYSLAQRRALLVDQLQDNGIEIDRKAYRNVIQNRNIPEQYIGNALKSAEHVLQGDERTAAAHLARFYGRDQDSALALVYGNDKTDTLLVDPTPLVLASIEMIKKLASRRNSFHALVAQANLMHHVTRSTGETLRELNFESLERQSALAFRSSIMGHIITSNDMEIARKYCHMVADQPLIAMIEEWAFPTYAQDVKPTPDFSLPRSLLLRKTADEIIREVAEYNDAYIFYLTSTSIRMMLRRDPTFGMKLDDLKKALAIRIETCNASLAQNSCATLLKDLDLTSPNRKADSFEDAW